MKKILYFTAGATPTSTELTEIGILNGLTQPGYSVGVRNGAESASYGAGIEDCDLVAGTIPTAFNAKTAYGTVNSLRPVKFTIISAVTLAALATKQLVPIAITGTDLSNLAAAVPDTGVTYASSAESKATVDANGLITAVATGSAVITATYTYTSGKTITATCAVTIS